MTNLFLFDEQFLNNYIIKNNILYNIHNIHQNNIYYNSILYNKFINNEIIKIINIIIDKLIGLINNFKINKKNNIFTINHKKIIYIDYIYKIQYLYKKIFYLLNYQIYTLLKCIPKNINIKFRKNINYYTIDINIIFIYNNK